MKKSSGIEARRSNARERSRVGGRVGPSSMGTRASPWSSFVCLAPVRNSRDADELRRVVDDVHHAPVTDPDAPMIFVALQFLASRGPRYMAQRTDFLDDARQHVVRQRFEFLPRGRLHFNGILTHAADRALRGPL